MCCGLTYLAKFYGILVYTFPVPQCCLILLERSDMFTVEEGTNKTGVLDDNSGQTQGGMWELWFVSPSQCYMRMIEMSWQGKF